MYVLSLTVFVCLFFDFDKFCLCKKKKKKKDEEKWWVVLVVFIWTDWNLTWNFNQSSVLMQNNDNFKQLLFC